MKIIFLHLPKTAGQSIHAALTVAFGPDAVCPARTNEHLYTYSIAQLNRYRVFSGHFDWSLLDCIKGPKFVFTVLRDPLERILSFYFFLRSQGESLSPAQREEPHNRGLNAAASASVRDFFLGGDEELRCFLDDHFDNFYAHYFAGRHFQGRREIAGLLNARLLTEERVIEIAAENMALLDGVFGLQDLTPLFDAIGDVSGMAPGNFSNFRENVNTHVPVSKRRDQLAKLGADEATFKRLNELCRMDQYLWKMYSER